MILVVYGTTGELIKLAPVMHLLRERGHPYVHVTTGQQAQQLPSFLDGLGLPRPELWLGRGARGGRDLGAQRDLPGWGFTVARRFARHRSGLRRRLQRGAGRPLVMTHGDTMTTVLGALMARALRVDAAHVESGLRSFDLRNPFPEELNRRIVSRLARIHYAPGEFAVGNLPGRTVVDTGSNTVRDSLALVPDDVPLPFTPPDEPFGIVSLHRNELLGNPELLRRTMALLADEARRVPLLFVDHSVTVDALRRQGLDSLFDGERLRRIPRLGFFPFVSLMRRSSFLVTDSGGSQEETYYLDLPCLVHRLRTERLDGLGETAVLSGYDDEVLRDFLADPGRFHRREPLPATTPSETIVADLEARGYV